MGKKKQHTTIRLFDFAPDRLTIRLISSRNCDMTDFHKLLKMFQQEFTDLHITLSEEALTHEWFAFVIESDTYLKFKRIRKIFKFLENSVVIADNTDVVTGEIFF